MAESTLLFQHSQRESSSPILAICIDSSTGNFITHDEKATRLWNLKKMLKSTRIERKEDNKFLELLCIARIERILVLFTPKSSIDEKGGSIQILSLNLARIQSIKLDYYSLSKFSISPSQTEVLLVDKNRSIFTVHVEFLLNSSTNPTAAAAKTLSAAETYQPKKVKQPPCMKLHEVQTLDLKKSVIIDAMMVNDNIFAVMGDKSIRLYSRPEVLYVPPPVTAVVAASVTSKPARKKWISKKDKAAMLAAGIDPDADPSAEVSAEPSLTSVAAVDTPVQKYNAFTRTGKLNIFHGRMRLGKMPTLLRLAGKDKLMIGFDDGTIQVLFCPSLVDPSTVKKADILPSMQITLGSPKHSSNEKDPPREPAEGTLAAVLCEFQAHFVAGKPGSVPGTADINLGTGNFTDNDLALGGSSLEGSFLDDMSEGSKELAAVGRSIKPGKIGVRAAYLCPWAACSGSSSDKGYQFELLTLGSDRRIVHWGVRFRDEQEDVVLVPHFANGTRASTAKIAAPQITDENTVEGEEDTFEEPDSSLAERSIAGANVPMESDLLGEYQLPQEPPTHIETGTGETLLAMAFELSLFQNPICKKIACVVGGMLMFFDALQPHRIFVGRKPELEKSALGVAIGTSTQIVRASRNDVSVSDMHTLILASAKGPELSTMVNRVGGQFKQHASDLEHTQSTMLVLRAHSVEIVLVQTGEVLQYLSTSNLQDAVLADPDGMPLLTASSSPTKKGMGRQGHLPLPTPLMRSSSSTFKEVRDVEGKPTAVHFCPITHLVLVGYNTGGVGLLALSGAIHSTFSKAPFAHLRTNVSHGSDITKIITFHHTLKYRSAAPGGPPPPADVVVALLGDANGVISLWQIYPAVKKGSLLLSVAQGHSAKIIHAHCCLLDENASHRIIVTACAQGIVKAWKLEGNGSLVLTAFFSVDLNGARLTSVLAIPSIYYEVMEQDDMSSNKSATGSLSSAAARNVVSSVHREILCVVGLSNGVIESWMISDHKARSVSRALARMRDTHSPVMQLIRHPSMPSLKVSLKNSAESLFSIYEPHIPIVGLCEDGTCVTMKMSNAGQLKRFTYFVMPAPINNAMCLFSVPPPVGAPSSIPSIGYNESAVNVLVNKNAAPVMECVVIGDFKAHHALPITNQHVPSLWHRSYDDSQLVTHQIDQGPLGASKYYNMTLSLTSNPSRSRLSPSRPRRPVSPTSTLQSSQGESRAQEVNRRDSEDAIAPVISMPGLTPYNPHQRSFTDSGFVDPAEQLLVREALEQQQQLAEGEYESNLVDRSISTMETDPVDDTDNFVGPMESMQRIVSSELHFAKKDSRLLELFTQHEPSADGTVSPETTADIVFAWLNTDKIAKQNIFELFRLLEIQDTDRLKFVEVAKIAAVVTSAMTKSNAGKSSGRGIAYKQMKQYTTKVTYNAMGEKSVEKILLSKGVQDGIFKGFKSTIRALWNKQQPRVLTQTEINRNAPLKMTAILQELPKAYSKLLPKGIPLPTMWNPENTHWFHPLRVIRIARMLLDIRSAKQHEVFLSSSLFQAHSSDVTSLQEIMVKYFERNYGDAGNLIDISRHKIAHFLEGCVQYKHHPIVNTLQSMLKLDPAQSDTPDLSAETAIWLCVEARSILCSRGCVIGGDLIQPFAEDFGYNKDGAALQARWQYVPKADVLLCTDEMLRNRGKFGPLMYDQILKIIDGIPSVDSFASADGQVHKTSIVSPMIDLERFLEVLYHEYIRLDKFIRQVEISVFGEQSMHAAVTAQTRDISKGKRRLVLDDHISTYGQHHEANMNKIRSWLVEFEPFDPMRTGLVSQEVLRNSVESRAAMINFLGPRNTPADVYKFIKFACDRFVSADPDSKVSYIDLFAVLCAWEWQTQGSEEFLLPELNKYLPTITRTIEQSYADNLLKYFTHMSSSDNYDPIWTMGAAPEGTSNPYASKSMVKSSSQLARDGFWNKDTNAPQDEPGLLTTQKEPIHNAGQVKITAAQDALKRERTKLSTDAIPVAPQILTTERVRTTAFGETLQSFRGLAVAPISRQTFDSTLLDPSEVHPQSRGIDFARTSYSRSIANISAITYSGGSVNTDDADSYFMDHESPGDLLTAPRPRTPEELRSHLMNGMDDLASQFISLENDSAVLPIDGSQVDGSQLNTNSLVEESLTAATFDSNYQEYSTGLLGTFNMSTSFESIDPNVVKKTLAEEEVARLRRAQAQREKELELLQRAEKEEMEKRREEKLRMREQIRRDMRRKEREGMAYYHAALDIKSKHNEMVRAKMNSIAEAEEADKHAKELEILRIQQENMARSQMKAFNKTSKANSDAESKAEHKELKLMRKEDEAMRKIAKKLAHDEKKLRDAQNKLDQEASDFLTAEMLAQYSASQADNSMIEDSNVLTLDTADTHESSAYVDEDGEDEHEHGHDGDEEEHEEEEGGDDEDAEAGEDDEEPEPEPAPVLLPPSPKKEEVVELSEEEIAAEEDRLSAEEEAESRRQQSAGQRRMSDFLDKIRQSTERHRTHPRRRAKKFSIPLMFSEDIFFDPFEIDLPEEEEVEDDGTVNMSLLEGSHSTVSKHDDDYYYDPYSEPAVPKDPFYDINSKLTLFRKEEERKRKALFSTTLQEIPSKDWIRVFRTYTVDWDGFFHSQAAMVELQNAVKESEQEIELHFRSNDPLKKITDTLTVSSPMMSRHSSQVSMHDRFSETDSEDQAGVAVTLLPYGKILDHQKVKQGTYKYFKIEQEKQSALLTVEVQCLTGLLDLYIAFQKLPSMAMHDRHIACTKDNKIARLAFRPHKSGTFFIAVRSHETDAKFNIWTYKASGTAEQSPIIGRVNNILRKFEILSSVDEEQLQEFFPKFEKEANKIVAEEIAERQLQDEAASLQEEYEKQQRAQLDDDDSIDELYDIESVDRFIAKVSKYTLQGDQAAHDDREDYQVGLGDDDELSQEYGQEIEDMFMPMHSKSMADLLLDEPQVTENSSPRASQGDLSLPPISRAYSVPSMNFTRSSVTMDSYLTDESGGGVKLPGIKGVSGTSTTTHSTSKRMVPKSRSSISVAREYAALDRALTGALAAKGIVERKHRPENPYLHVVPKPVKYQLTGPKF